MPYTLSVWPLELFNNRANCCRNSACFFCDLVTSSVDWGFEIGESVTESSVVVVEDKLVAWTDVSNSNGLWETGSTIANGFLWRLSKSNVY